MIILSISTSSNICSVALLENENLIEELNIDNSRTHSENLMSLIDTLLTSHNTKISDVTLIACDTGPGSFTGIRIGISTIKGLSVPNNTPIIGISSLNALAYNIAKSDGYICALIDARNNQVYCGIFDNNYNLCEDYIADDINNVLITLKKYSDITFVGDGTYLVGKDNVKYSQIHAHNIGIAAYIKYNQSFFQTADEITPLYLRPSQAERMKSKDE